MPPDCELEENNGRISITSPLLLGSPGVKGNIGEGVILNSNRKLTKY